MNEQIHIEVAERVGTGKNESRRLRASGKIPAVVYGGGREPVAVEVDPRPVEAILESPTGLNSLINLRLGGRELKRMVMLRQIQRHPVTERIEHADFVRVEMDKPLTLQVPVELVGVPVGVKTEGGLVDFVTREVTIKVLPDRIPGTLIGRIEDLHIGQHLEAGDLELPEDVELLTPPTHTIANCTGKPVEEEVVSEEVEGEEAPVEGDESSEGPADTE